MLPSTHATSSAQRLEYVFGFALVSQRSSPRTSRFLPSVLWEDIRLDSPAHHHAPTTAQTEDQELVSFNDFRFDL